MLSYARSRLVSNVSVRRTDYIVGPAIVLTLVLASRYLVINLMLPQSSDPDEGVYLMVGRLLGLGYPYHTFFFDQFWLFPQIIATAFHFFGDSAETGRLTVVAFSLLGLLGMALLTWQLGAKWAAPLAILFGVVNHYYLTQSRFTMTDVPSIALMLWALVTMLAFTSRGSRWWLAASGLFCAASLLIKPLGVGFCVPLAYWLVRHRVTRVENKWHLDVRGLLADAGVLFGAGLLTAAPFLNLLDLPGEFQRTVAFHWDEKDFFAADAARRQLALVSFVSENRVWLALAALGAVTASWRRPERALPLLVGEALSVGVLMQLPPWWHHYTLLTPMLAIFAAVGVNDGVTALVGLIRAFTVRQTPVPDRRILKTGLYALAFGVALLWWLHDAPQLLQYNLTALLTPSSDTTALVRYLRKNYAPGSFMLSDNPMVVYLAGELLPPSAINLPYVSTFGFSGVSADKLNESVTDYPVKAVVVTGPYKTSPQLMTWIETHYPSVHPAGGGASNTVFANIYTSADTIAQTATKP